LGSNFYPDSAESLLPESPIELWRGEKAMVGPWIFEKIWRTGPGLWRFESIDVTIVAAALTGRSPPINPTSAKNPTIVSSEPLHLLVLYLYDSIPISRCPFPGSLAPLSCILRLCTGAGNYGRTPLSDPRVAKSPLLTKITGAKDGIQSQMTEDLAIYFSQI
jgi:hypothetical protein